MAFSSHAMCVVGKSEKGKTFLDKVMYGKGGTTVFRQLVWQARAWRSCRHLSQALPACKIEVMLNQQRTMKWLEEGRSVFKAWVGSLLSVVTYS